MVNDDYFVIALNEDGEVYFTPMSGATLRKRLAEKYYGDDPKFIHKFILMMNAGETSDMMSLPDGVFIIRGSIVDPASL